MEQDAFAVKYIRTCFANVTYLLFCQYNRGSALSSSVVFSFDEKYCIIIETTLYLNFRLRSRPTNEDV